MPNLIRSLCLSALALSISGCGAERSYSAGVYRDAEARYRVGQPAPGWRRVAVEGQNDLAWHHTKWRAVIQVNASCNPGMDVPLKALTTHLLIGFTEREIREQKLVPLDKREALLTHLVAKLDGVPMELLFTVLKKDGCVYDFALIAPPDNRFARARRDYEAVVAGFGSRS